MLAGDSTPLPESWTSAGKPPPALEPPPPRRHRSRWPDRPGQRAAVDLANRARAIPEIAAAESADLAYRKAGEWTVIDFKTADLPDRAAAMEAHGAQFEVYCQALGSITGAPVRAALCLLRSGQLLDLGAGA
jgi:ATP-dependent exoDNAse (exonuclease V) beta subunit